ncbi:hypothetical protein D9758_004466 [Tetrapyrgos nigripes]|uniref:ABC transporter n=1 Tax=Tetrapyrgos nigripes TaxID=182062 RepID=A0A8H5GNB8_9AGAR|nr:hypothetical protein D9758_004466 [Tetrapyrgos nigripes]
MSVEPSNSSSMVTPTAFPPRPWHSRVPFVSTKTSPPPESLDEAEPIPEDHANWFSYISFSWMTSLLVKGYARPLEATDLYRLGLDRSAEVYADRIVESFERRRREADAFNQRLNEGLVHPAPWKMLYWSVSGQKEKRVEEWKEHARQKPSFVLACNDAIFWWFWSGGFFRLIADVGIITSPLIVKAIIRFATRSHNNLLAGEALPNIGPGVGLALGLFAVQIVIFLSNAQAYYRGYTTGVILRGALIHAIFSKSLRLTSRARSAGGYTTGKLTSLISADVSRIDFCSPYFHMAFTCPIQMMICLAILCVNLGYSALPGFAFFVLASPLQGKITKMLFRLRKRSVVWTDNRISLLQELLGNIRLIKIFAWEVPFLERVDKLRNAEMKFLRSRLMLRSVNNALGFGLPTLAAVLSFITYALVGHSLDAAIIFSSLSLFNLLRTPLTFLPVALSSMADAYNAMHRVEAVFNAEVISGGLQIDPELEFGVEVKNAVFTWDSPPPVKSIPDPKPKVAPIPTSPNTNSTSFLKTTVDKAMRLFGKSKPVLPTLPIATPSASTINEKEKDAAAGLAAGQEKPQPPSIPVKEEDRVFKVKNINLAIPKGQLCAIVGPVGSGKSSLLQGLVGEMRRTEGTVVFGDRVGYCPQVAWIQSATIRDNITFGQPFDEERYWKVVKDSCLLADFAMFPDGDMTEVGEKGISLSGGQKQRINIARALYFGSKVTLFDDSFSALDAHVGKDVFENVMKKALDGTTRIIVTHALHFLPYVDYIITLNDGQIVETGTYAELMSKEGLFAKFIKDFGTSGQEEVDEKAGEKKDKQVEESGQQKEKQSQPRKKLMQNEDRNVGSVSWKSMFPIDLRIGTLNNHHFTAYAAYFRAGHLSYTFPLFVIAVCFFQGSSVLSPYWLVWWQDKTFSITQGTYMAIYAVLGFCQAFGLFSMGVIFAQFTFDASRALHRFALKRVMHAPTSFFDTTPLGRIMNRFSKDIDTIDNVVGEAMRQFLGTMVQVIGSVVLVSIIIPWFLIAIAFILLLYYYIAIFYRASAREIKRLDAVLRSSLYSHFSESISGLTTIRAYGESKRFEDENTSRIDLENRAYWLSVTNQRWLSVRLDFLGSVMVFAVAIMAVGTRADISPAQTGVVLSYILVVQQAFGWAVRQSAEVENNMNAVERVLYYAHSVEQEAPHEIPETKPPTSWPSSGAIEMENVVASYRPGLPAVLKGVSLNAAGGEHIGIVGRTGAGKSTVTMTLYRTIELLSGSIKIDGIDISRIGLRDLRSSLSIIPQDPTLFSGDLRSNLDPFGQYDDARLWDALKRSYLVETTKSDSDSTLHGKPQGQLTLDSRIEEGGSNLSVGQRSLVSLARALTKNSRVIIMDEATASVDFETDYHIQNTVQSEFAGKTLLCIAHRLRTIIGYDKICVVDAGVVVECDKPEVLMDREGGVFRGMCERSGISLSDVLAARRARQTKH